MSQHHARSFRRAFIPTSRLFKSENRYPAIALAMAAVTVAVVPLTASAESHTVNKPAAVSAPAKPAAAHKAPAPAAPAPVKAAPAPAPVQVAAKPAPAPVHHRASHKRKHTTDAVTLTAAPNTSGRPFAGAGTSQIQPVGAQGSQQSFTPTSAQWSNATAIVQAAHDLGMTPYAATIAVATAMQESTLQNLTVAVNADSLGLFQQRPSMGWGSPSQLTDPAYAAKAFLKQLPSGYNGMALANAAQSVQRSFDGSLYAQWQDQAAQMVNHIANG